MHLTENLPDSARYFPVLMCLKARPGFFSIGMLRFGAAAAASGGGWTGAILIASADVHACMTSWASDSTLVAIFDASLEVIVECISCIVFYWGWKRQEHFGSTDDKQLKFSFPFHTANLYLVWIQKY